jgi:hypothetical protein
MVFLGANRSAKQTIIYRNMGRKKLNGCNKK